MHEAVDQLEGGEEGRVVGHVKWQVYTAYTKAVGMGLVLFVLLSLALMQASIPASPLPPSPCRSPASQVTGNLALTTSLSSSHVGFLRKC